MTRAWARLSGEFLERVGDQRLLGWTHINEFTHESLRACDRRHERSENLSPGHSPLLKGGQDLYDELANILGLKKGQSTTDDGEFSLEGVRCIGCCGLAPVISVNGEVYGNLVKSQLAGIVDKYRK